MNAFLRVTFLLTKEIIKVLGIIIVVIYRVTIGFVQESMSLLETNFLNELDEETIFSVLMAATAT